MSRHGTEQDGVWSWLGVHQDHAPVQEGAVSEKIGSSRNLWGVTGIRKEMKIEVPAMKNLIAI